MIRLNKFVWTARKYPRKRLFSAITGKANVIDCTEDHYAYRKSEYATDWKDPNYPEWQQFLEVGSKRVYYHNRKDNSVSWTSPDSPNTEFDIVAYEKTLKTKPLTQLPLDLPPASLSRRFAAFGLDFLASTFAGSAFALAVYADIGSWQGALASVGFSTWVFLLGRDMTLEQGTRSPGKKLMKLEIVTDQGRLPSRYNNFFRQIPLPVYAGSALLMPYVLILPVLESGLLLFTKDQRRIGDFIGRTKVIDEQKDRETRLKEKKDADLAEELME